MSGMPAVIRRVASSVVALTLLAAAASAQTLLTLTNPSLPAASGQIELDEAALKALPQHTLKTKNEFVTGVAEFTGPLASDVIALIGRSNANIAVMTAANDYSVEIPLGEFTKYEVIFAMTMNGVPLSRRDKGPIWVIYPMDQYPELQDPSFNNRLIWQLVKVELR
jgi:hypothetical protein